MKDGGVDEVGIGGGGGVGDHPPETTKADG